MASKQKIGKGERVKMHNAMNVINEAGMEERWEQLVSLGIHARREVAALSVDTLFLNSRF